MAANVVRSTTNTAQALVGRRAECARLDQLLADARTGTSAAVVVRGEAGVGKSALLEYLLMHAAGCRVVRAAGAESEMELPFATLHQLCLPLLDELERLPGPQREALGTALGVASGRAADRFLVGVAVLSLLSDNAETQPLVCLVDDAHWLDRASAQVLGFVARRLAAESVVLIFAARTSVDTPDFAGLPELTIGPLLDSDARAVLEAAIPGKLDESGRARIADAAEPATASGLIDIGTQVRFRHPLVRSVVYREAPVSQRRLVHGALAEATDPAIDPDRRAWHLAAAASGPDEDIAAELERSAARAQARGGFAAAAAFLERAVALTGDPARRAERALVAAQATFQAGAFDAVQPLLATAEAYPLDDFHGAQADLLRGHLTFVLSYGSDGAPLLLQAARRLEPFDLQLARQAYLTAWGAALTAGYLGGAGVMIAICRAIRALPPPPDAADPLHLVIDGLAQLTIEGHAAATPTLQRAAKAVMQLSVEDVVRWGWQAPAPSTMTWDSDAADAIFERHAKLVRDAGALADLPVHLNSLGLVKAWDGDLEGAGVLIAESDRVAAAIGSPIPPFAALSLLARQGREPEAAALIEATIKQSTAGGQGIGVVTAQWAAAVLCNGLARFEEAASAAGHVIANAGPTALYLWALPEHVEAAARSGDTEVARHSLERLAGTTQPAGTDYALGMEARSRALLSDGAAPEHLYRQANA